MRTSSSDTQPVGMGAQDSAERQKFETDDWGLWRTNMNLGKVRDLAQTYALLLPEHKSRVERQVSQALARVSAEPKPLAWRLRARVGDRVKWYKDVDEVK